jgi:hypothetical protein
LSDLRAYQPSFTSGELSPALWARVDLTKYGSGCKTAINMFIHPHGGASNRAGLEFINELKTVNVARTVAFQFNTVQSYMLEFGGTYGRVYRDGGLVLSSVSKLITAITQASPGVLTSVAHGYTNGQEIDVSGVLGMTAVNASNWIVRNVTANTFTLESLGGVALNTSGLPAYVSGGTIRAVYEFVTPFAAADLAGVSYIQEADVMYFFSTLYAPRKLSRLADDNWVFSTPTFAPSIAAPTGQSAVRTVGAAGANVSYKIAAISDATSEESLPSNAATISCDLSIAGNKNTISWSTVSGALRYVVYKLDNGVYGYIGGTTGLSFVDDNITADLADTPQTGRNPFIGAGNYPRCGTFVEQRLALASSLNDPQACWISQSANYENFGYASPAKESDSITFRIRARQVNEIRSMLPVRGLMALTSGAEWIVSGANTDYLTPAVKIVNQGYRGAATVQPVVVGNTVLFAQDRGGVIRDFSYEFQQDSFTGKDLTILARHMFEGRTIKAWAYAQAPYSIIWVVLDDGSLASLTYLKEHEVWGWTRQQTDGLFEDVSVIAENGEDVPYFIIKRTIQGVDRRYLERLHTRQFTNVADAFFVDSGLTYEGTPITALSAPHLAGKTAAALVDGNVVRGLVVGADGTVTLPFAGSVIHLGLPYTATLQTLDLDLGSVQGIGSVQSRWKSVTEVSLRVEKTRGIWIGPTEATVLEYKQRSTEAWDDAIQAYTGDITQQVMWEWTKGGSTWVKQFDPLPMTVLAVMPDVTLAR